MKRKPFRHAYASERPAPVTPSLSLLQCQSRAFALSNCML
jgi:hypothetical protein